MVLRWARERLNLDLKEVEKEAKKLSRLLYAPVTEGEIASWEIGQGEPSLAQLETFAYMSAL